MENFTCFECGEPATVNHHVIPKSKGGTKTIPLCTQCHSYVHDARLVTSSELIKIGKQAARNVATVNEVIKLYEQDVSKLHIATSLNISRDKVYRILELAGLHEDQARGCEIKITSQVMLLIKQLRKLGRTWEQIANEINISHTHMYRLILENNWSDNVYGGSNPKRVVYRKLTNEMLDEARSLKQKGWTMVAIAKKFGVDRVTLYNHKIHKTT